MIFKRYFKRFQISAYKKAKNFCTQCYKRAGCGVRTVFPRYGAVNRRLTYVE